MRLYVPSTLPGLARVVRAQEIGPPPLGAYAVTPALRQEMGQEGEQRQQGGADSEELEYAAMSAAANASTDLLAEEAETAPTRQQRVVLAADVPDSAVRAGSHPEPSAVLVDQAVPYARIASAHVDEPGAGADAELLWYARQEFPDLIEGEEREPR